MSVLNAHRHVDGLVERERELAALDAAFAEASAGRGRVVLVTAEAGGGKTALIDGFCANLAGSTRAWRGACDALFTPRPLGPFLDFAADAGPDLRGRLAGDAVPYEVASALIDEVRSGSPTVLVVEDIHWADEATLDVLRLVARRIATAGVLIVLSYRDEALDVAHPVRVMLGELATGLPFTRLPLAPLSPEAVAQLADPYDVEPLDLYLATAGNPFFVTEVLASGSDSIPSTVRDAVLARAARLSSDAREVLSAVAIAPPQVELWLLEALAREHLRALEECATSGMLLESSVGTIAFRHELARLAIEQSLEPRQRRDLHREALTILTEPPAGMPDPARLAHHADAASDAEAALRFAPAAAEAAAAVGAHREAAAQYARALRYGNRLTPGEKGDLLRQRAVSCLLADQYEESLEAATQAIEEYRAIGDRLREADALRMRSDAGWCPGYVAASTRDAWDAVELLGTIPPSRELANAYANLGVLHKDAELTDEAKVWSARAIELGRELGAKDVVISATRNVCAAEILAGTAEGMADVEAVLASAVEAGLINLVGGIYYAALGPASATRNYPLIERHLAPGLQHCSDHGLELFRLYLLAYTGRVALDTGRWEEAAESAQAVLRVPRCSISPRILALVVLALVRARRGDPAVRELLEEAWALAEPTGELPRMGPVAVARAEVAWLLGRSDEIAAATDAALELAVRRQSTWRMGELLSWRRRASIRDDIAVEPRGPFRAEAAGEWRQAADQWERLGCPYEAALALGDADQEEPLRQALDQLRQLGARPAAAIVARRLRKLGVRGVTRGPRPSTVANAAALTTREIDVLRLLAEGLRNAAIGERLFVSPRTVEHHVSAILTKLGVKSRGEAVAEAGRLGLLQDP